MEFIEEARQLFGDEVRPEHFTNHEHCCECAEHDATLQNSNPEQLTYDDLRPGWDPLCFINPEGFRYYFPALAKLAIEGSGPTYFVDRLVFHLELDGKNNRRYEAFSPAQRDYVVRLLQHLIELHADEIEQNLDVERLFRTIEIWQGDTVA